MRQKRVAMIETDMRMRYTASGIVVLGQPAMRRQHVAEPVVDRLASEVEKHSAEQPVLCADTLEHTLRKIAARHIRLDA